jgi:hypothetical protein
LTSNRRITLSTNGIHPPPEDEKVTALPVDRGYGVLVEVGVAGTAGAVVSGVVEGVRRAGEVGAGTAVSRVVVRPGAPGVSCGNGEVVT